MEYQLRSFLSWSALILLDVAARGAVVQEQAHAVFTISKISFCTKPTVISSFSTLVFFYVNPAVHFLRDHLKKQLHTVSGLALFSRMKLCIYVRSLAKMCWPYILRVG